MELIDIILVEDDEAIRESLEILLDGSEGVRCVQSFPTGTSYLTSLQELIAHVVLMDITLPDHNGIDLTRKTKNLRPDLEVIMLTVHRQDDLVFQSLCNGASGYLVKNSPSMEIIAAVKECISGGAPMSTVIARMIVESYRPQQQYFLTDRETEVLEHLCEGLSYKMIADQMYISVETVRTHIKNIYSKLGVNSNVEAVVKAIKDRIVS